MATQILCRPCLSLEMIPGGHSLSGRGDVQQKLWFIVNPAGGVGSTQWGWVASTCQPGLLRPPGPLPLWLCLARDQDTESPDGLLARGAAGVGVKQWDAGQLGAGQALLCGPGLVTAHGL